MDYANLAQLSNPGPAPYGGVNASNIFRWKDMNEIQQQALQGGQRLAGLDEQNQIMKNEELTAGQPGRVQSALNQNELIKHEATLMDKVKQVRGLQLDDAIDTLTKKGADFLTPLKPFGQVWSDINNDPNLPTEERAGKLKALTGAMRGQGIKVGKKNFDDMSETEQFVLLEMIGRSNEGAANLINKKEISSNSNEARVAIASLNNAGANTRAALRASVTKEIAAARDAISKNKPMTTSQLEAMAVLETSKGDMQRVEEYFWNKAQLSGMATATAKAETAQGLGIPGVVAPSPVQRPTVPEKSASENFTVGGAYQGKEILGILRDPKTNKVISLNVKGLGVVEIK